MKAHTSEYKQNVSRFAREIDSKITYSIDDERVELGAEELNSISYHYEGSILKSVMKQLDIDSNVEIPINTVVTYQFGVKVGSEYEYINYGKYIVYSVEKQEDTQSYKITCYDKMLYAMTDYQALAINYPITIREYIKALCDKLGLEFANEQETFVNYDKEIENELFLSTDGNNLDYKFRDVLDQLAEVTASTICINESTDKLEIRYINDSEDSINEEYLKDINVNFGKKFGPVNSIVLSRSAESDNVYLNDEESIDLNGLCEIKIVDNQIMNFNDRDQFLPDILEKLDGLEYYINDFSSTGITYYELCDKYTVSIEGNNYNCIMFNDEINVTQGLEENIFTEFPEETNTDYSKADKTDRKVNQTWIIANKQEGYIQALTSRTETLENTTYTIEQVNSLIQNAETGVTNTFSEAGGNNIFRNTGLWFEETKSTNAYTFPNNELYPSNKTFSGAVALYEYWVGYAKREYEEKAVNSNAIIVQKGSFMQTQDVPNGNYTISFYYQKLNQFANTSVVINDVEYPLDSMDAKLFYTGEKLENSDEYIVQPIVVNSKRISIEFKSSIDSGLKIYDLMCNAGSIKLAYSQNQNETTTDTVNISKGITITSTNVEAIFKANADGIRILTLTGNVVAYFTDKGLSTKELVVENEAQIVKTLWQEVGDQTWITRI